jgi:hypothetical protein
VTCANASRAGASRITSLAWDEPGWLAEAIDWIDQHVARSGEVELVRTRPWSAIVRVPGADGVLWFKEDPPSLAFEPALTEFLSIRHADCIPEVVAAEGRRLLAREAGPQLRTLLEAREPAPGWDEIVTRYAELQIELVPLVEQLDAPDSRPEAMAERFGARELLAELGDTIPLSLIHEEVHDGNVLVRDGAPVFIDWAEASISHPFAGLVNTLRSIGPEQAPRIRDAYLEPWTRFAPLADLREIFAAAYALGCLCRSASWDRILSPLPADSDARREFDTYTQAWLEIYAEAREHPDRLGV